MFKWLNKIRLKGLPTKTDNNVVVVDDNGDLGINTGAGANAYHGYSVVWIIASDFVSDKGNLIYNTGGVIDKTTSAIIYANVLIPNGATATHVIIYSNTSDADVNVYSKFTNSATETSKGTGNTNSSIDIIDVTADPSDEGTNLAIQITPNDQSADRFYGGKVTLS